MLVTFSSVPEHAATHCQGLHSDFDEIHKTIHAHREASQHPGGTASQVTGNFCCLLTKKILYSFSNLSHCGL